MLASYPTETGRAVPLVRLNPTVIAVVTSKQTKLAELISADTLLPAAHRHHVSAQATVDNSAHGW